MSCITYCILHTINPVWCRPTTVPDAGNSTSLLDALYAIGDYTENILRYAWAWKLSHTSILEYSLCLEDRGSVWIQKQQEGLACSWKPQPMVRQVVPAGATFPAPTQALTISPASAQIQRRPPDAPYLVGFNPLRHRRQWSKRGVAMNGKLMSNGVARSAYEWNTSKARRRFGTCFDPTTRPKTTFQDRRSPS